MRFPCWAVGALGKFLVCLKKIYLYISFNQFFIPLEYFSSFSVQTYL